MTVLTKKQVQNSKSIGYLRPIKCTVTNKRSLKEQGGLEVQCELMFSISDTVKDRQTMS